MLSQSVRQLRRSPGFVLFAVVILGLGIGANASIFSVLNTLLLRPLPYPEGDKIVRLMNRTPRFGLTQRVSGPNFKDWLDRTQSFSALARYRGGELALTANDRAQFAEVYWVSPGFFSVFSLAPVAGQLPDVKEYLEDRAESAVISWSFWQTQYGGSPAAMGQTVKVDNRLYRITAVAPRDFGFPAKGSVWLFDTPKGDMTNRTANNFSAVGRVKPNLTLEQAQAELDTIASTLAAQYPKENKDRGIALLSVAEQQARPYRQTLELLFAATLLLLLIACANVSSLLLARAISRQREFAVRASLGAQPTHLLAQVLLESLMLGLAACVSGLFFANMLTRGLVQMLPDSFPRASEIGIDPAVFAFAAALAIGSSVLCSLYPAWHIVRTDILSSLKMAGQKGALGGSSGLFRRSLATAQIALSLTMLCGALLLARSMSNLLGVDMGIDPVNLLVSYTHIPAEGLEGHKQATVVLDRMLNDLRAQPDVAAAAAVMGMPTGKYGSDGSYFRADQPMPTDFSTAPNAGFRLNTAKFFSTMRIPLVRGREFTEQDSYDAPFVAIINQALAKKSFPNEDPIGKQLLCGLDSPKPMTIVGVVGDVRHDGPGTPPGPELYMPLAQHPFYANEVQIAVRAKADPRPLSDTVRATAARYNKDIAVNSLTLASMIESSVASSRFRMVLMLTLSLLALTLAAAGVYGVLSYLVGLRMGEFGLRRALGASSVGILQLVTKEAGLILGVGTGLGLALTIGLEQFLRSFLFGVSARDGSTMALAVLAMVCTALVASALPSITAMRVDPMRVLRSE